MPNTPKLRDIISTFNENELDLNVPIDFQDISLGDVSYVNTYNTYLQNGQFEEAYSYREENSDHIEKYILDATKINYLQTMLINSYLFSKEEKNAKNTSFDNSSGSFTSSTVQGAIEELAGLMFKKRTLSSTIDIDDLYNDKHQGCYWVDVSQNVASNNHAFDTGFYRLIVIENLQIAINTSATVIKIRTRINSEWTKWNRWVCYEEKAMKSMYISDALKKLSTEEKTIGARGFKQYRYTFDSGNFPIAKYTIDHVIFSATNTPGLICQDTYLIDNGSSFNVNVDIFNASDETKTFDHLSFWVFYIER